MASDAFELLSKALPASRTVSQAYAYIQGGQLVQTLEAVADVHLTSAIDHLRQAQRSTHARNRLLQSAGDLQIAYFAYFKAVSRGVLGLRRLSGFAKLRRLRGLASGSAATVALLQWYLDEHPENRREWLDRAARQVSDYWRDVKARQAFGDSPVVGAFIGGHYDVPPWVPTEPLEHYLALERNLLPAELVRPVPIGFLSRAENLKRGNKYDPNDPQHILPQYRTLD